MKVLVLGGDGYLGWPTAMALASKGWSIGVVDNLIKRKWEAEVGVSPLIPISTIQDRVRLWNSFTENGQMKLRMCDIATNRHLLYKIFDEFHPDAVVHYAEQPSAPFSMVDANRCYETQVNNVLGTVNLIHAVKHYNPQCHIVKLGTMGEYGTPNIDIEEGWLDVTHNERTDRVLFPKRPGSWYHATKVHDSTNLEFACRTWGLRVTDLNQGVVYGISTDETWLQPEFTTSFHYDSIFGTVLNRFIVQSIYNTPLTVYGEGGQTRGFLDIRDTIQCITLALENSPTAGEFRVMNQMTEQFSVLDLAEKVCVAIGGKISHIDNPRVEEERHYYNAKHTSLEKLGLKPHLLTNETIQQIASKVMKYKKKINEDLITPKVRWRQ